MCSSDLLNLILSLKNRYPNRKFLIVFHSSGATRRFWELPNCFLKVEIVDDFIYVSEEFEETKTNNLHFYIQNIRKVIRDLIRILLIKSCLVIYIENEKDFASIKFWTIHIRGHYSNLLIPNENLLTISNLLKISSEKSVQNAIHFRLGDLLYINSKSPIDIFRIGEAFNKISQLDRDSVDWVIYSDSPLEIGRAHV